MLRRCLTSLLIVAGLVAAAHAREQANPNPRESNSNEAQREYQRAYAAARAARPAGERRGWMGVSVSPAPQAVAHQLKLPEGTGLVVDYAEPKSPADEAGIKPYDLLLKMDDQLLVNPEQFAVLVRMHKAGDEVKLSILREGQSQTVTVKLIEHEVPRLADLERLQLWNEPRGGFAPPELPVRIHPRGDVQKSVTWFDGKRQITVDTEEGKSTLIVSDPASGRILLKAPVDTEEQRNALPEDIRGVLKNLPMNDKPEGDAKPGGDAGPSPTPKQ